MLFIYKINYKSIEIIIYLVNEYLWKFLSISIKFNKTKYKQKKKDNNVNETNVCNTKKIINFVFLIILFLNSM